jgi:membrane protein
METGLETKTTVPLEDVRPVVRRDGLGAQLVALAKYMVRTEVHTYAFSVAANAILSLIPFTVMLLTISRHLFHSQQAVIDMMNHFLPANQAYIMRNVVLLTPRKGMQIYSIVMLLISSTGVFLPLEVALNGVWGAKENRSYLKNQLVSLSLACLIGILAMLSVGFSTAQTWVFFGHTEGWIYSAVNGATTRVLGATSGVLIFFLIYWILPNRKIPARAVLPTAVVIGLSWEGAKYLYVLALPRLDFYSVYGPFAVSVGLMIWAFLSGLLLLAGAHFSATRYALRTAREEEEQTMLVKETDAAGA